MTQPQQRVQTVLDRLVGDGVERGLQVAVYLDGELVIDAWAGVADATTGQPVDGATLFPVFSVTKGITATIIHRLVERGQLAYDVPVAEYWPAFAANGKAAITVRHIMSHTAGIPLLPDGLRYADYPDWAKMCSAIANQKPLWPAGTKMEYHPRTYGYVLGEIARRVTGRSYQTLLDEEIRRPLGLRDLYVGIPDDLRSTIAVLEDSSPPVPNETLAYGAWLNLPAGRKACLPSSTGIMNARSIARHYAALVPGGVDGVELLSPQRVRAATAMQTLVSGEPVGRALGYMLGGDPFSPMGSRRTAFGHDGYGGPVGFADPASRLAFGLTKNRIVNDPPPGQSAAYLVAREVRAALGVPEAGR